MFTASRRLACLAVTGTLILAAGCGGGSSSSTPVTTPSAPGTPTTTPAMSLYVYQDNDAFSPPSPSTILQFAKADTGMATPLSTITGPANVIFQTLAEDATGNLYVGAATYNATPNAGPGVINILQYAAGATGTATPLRSISGAATGLQQFSNNIIEGIDLDAAGNLYVAADVAVGSGPAGRLVPGISVFAPTANGDAAPAKVIAGALTTLTAGPPQIAVTPTGTVYMPSPAFQQPESLLLFAPTATGNVAPTATLGGTATTIFTIKGVALDAAQNIYIASLGESTSVVAESAIPSILVFAAGSTGNIAPARMITGTATTLQTIGRLRVDSAGNIFVLSGSTILKFAAGATGNVAPTASFTSNAYFQPAGSLALQ